MSVKSLKPLIFAIAALLLTTTGVRASEGDLAIPNLNEGHFNIAGLTISAWWLLFWGAWVIAGTLSISLYLRTQIHRLPAHQSMLSVADVIYKTCQTYLIQQGKFLLMLFVLIACAMSYYILGFTHGSEGGIGPVTTLILVLLFSVVGMGGSYAVAWYGIRVNTYANCRTAFASLRGRAVGRRQHPAAGRHVGRPVPDLARTGHDGHHPAVRAARRSSASASSASPSANRSAPRPCASPAASSPRSPTSAPT